MFRKSQFSKKHYEAVARALKDAREIADMSPTEEIFVTVLHAGINLAERELAATFAGDSASFDRERFAQASGMRGVK